MRLMRRVWFLFAALFAPSWAHSEAGFGTDGVLAFANKQDVYMFVGRFDPRHGWMQPDSFYLPPQPSQIVSVFGIKGLLGQPRITSPFRPAPYLTPRDWEATVAPWHWQEQAQALVITGKHDDLPRKPTVVSKEDPDALGAVRAYLKHKGLNVEHPQLTQVLDIDAYGDGKAERFICAHSNDEAIRTEDDAVVYAVAMEVGGENKIFNSQTWRKPAGRTRAQDEALHGARDYLRFLTFIDLNNDGKLEAVVYDAKTDATQIDVYSLESNRWKNVLTSFRTLVY